MGLFGKDKSTVVKGAVDLVGNIRGMIDDSKFTAEEKARFNIQIADATAEYAKATLSENTERSKARRHIAIVSIYFFYFLVMTLLILWRFAPEWFEAAKQLIVEFKLPTAFIMIMAFFFGGYYLNKLPNINTGKNKKD
jgi:hypothetical protein